MKQEKIIFILFSTLAILLFGVMCAVVAYSYASMECAIRHYGTSAPASVVFLYSIPFVLAIAVCVMLAYVFYRKLKK